MSKVIYSCPECDGIDIEVEAWVEVNNNNKYVEDITERHWYCNDCGEILYKINQTEEKDEQIKETRSTERD